MRLFVILTTVSAVIAIPLPVRLRKRCGYDAGAVYPRGTFGSDTDITAPTDYSTNVNNFGGGYPFSPGTPVTQPPSPNSNQDSNFCSFPIAPDISNSGNGGNKIKEGGGTNSQVNSQVTSNVKYSDPTGEFFDFVNDVWDSSGKVLNTVPGMTALGGALYWGGKTLAPVVKPLFSAPNTDPSKPGT